MLVLIDKLSKNILWDRLWPRVDSRASTRNHRTSVLQYAFIRDTERDDKGIVGIHAAGMLTVEGVA